MNSELFLFSREILLRNLSCYFFLPEYTISDEIIELNSVWNRILVSCDYYHACNYFMNLKHLYI
jgi:hypothetical protein